MKDRKIYCPPATLEEVEAIAAEITRALFPVVGDCLEGAGVVDGGIVAVDFTRFPAPPRYLSKGGDGSTDLCACWAVFPGHKKPDFMLKVYHGVWGPWKMVGTCYDPEKGVLDCGMEAQKILGVVLASWDRDGKLLWQREPASFPDRLGTEPTIHGENVGEPIPIRSPARALAGVV